MKFIKKLIYGKRYGQVRNDAGERIETLRFVVPALRVGVLEYAPGQLQTGYTELQGKTVKLYYPPEALQDKSFLKSLENAPIVLGGHDKTTSENNKDIDGWPRSVHYDEAQKAAIVDGTVKGKRESDYIRENYKDADFGASAFLDIYGLKAEEGVTPEGEPYNAVATKLRATHLALAPSVRDPENKIEIVNNVAVNSKGVMGGNSSVTVKNGMKGVEVTYSDGSSNITSVSSGVSDEDIKKYFKVGSEVNIGKTDDKMVKIKSVKILNTKTEEKMEIGKEELVALVKNTMTECLTKNTEGEELDKIKQAIAEIQAVLKTLMEAKGSEEKERTEAGNEDEKKEDEKEDATLENAVPSQKLVSVFSTAFNTDFGHKTPSFKVLGALAGIKAENPAELITAVNTKFAELSKTTVQNDKPATTSIFGGSI